MSLCHAPLTALPLLLACVLAPAPAGAQPSQPGNYDYLEGDLRFTAPMVVLLVVLVTAFLFIGFFLVYVRHCRHGAAGSADASAVPALTRRRQQRGLDAEVLESFPTMKYAEAKELRVGKDAALECAVCLSEFDDEEQLTFLPKCSHAFHPDCIREWLASHVTCPVCRCNLEADRDVAGESGVTVPETSASEEPAIRQEEDSTGAQPAEVVIDVNTEEEERRKEAVELERIGSHRRAMRSPSGRAAERLARSHTTGHSVAFRFDGNLERFTLRLPDHVRREMVAAGEESLRRWRRTGEGSSRGGGGRSVLLGRERLPSFLARTFSARVPFWAASRRAADGEGGEGSTTKRPPAADVAAAAAAAAGTGNGGVRFDCLGGGISGARVGAAAGEDDEKEIARQV